MAKIGIIGVGKNGEAFAHTLLPLGHDIYLLNRTPKRAYGVMEDLIDGYPHFRQNIHVCESYDEQLMSTDMVFVVVKGNYEYQDFKSLTDLRTRGLPRDGYLLNNVAEHLQGYTGYVVVVSNPVDLNAKQIMLHGNLSAQKVLAYGSQLDTWRAKNELARQLNIDLHPETGNREALNLYFMGEHGDTTFGLWDAATYHGKPLQELGFTSEIAHAVESYVRKRGVDVILKKGDTTIGTSMAVPELVSWLMESRQGFIIPVSTFDEDNGIFYGRPVKNISGNPVSCLPQNFGTQAMENLEQSMQKIRDGENFAGSLFVKQRKRNILYVDDDAETIKSISGLLRMRAFRDADFRAHNLLEFYGARTLHEAKKILYGTMSGIDVLLIDQRLTGEEMKSIEGREMNGIEFVLTEVVPNHPATVPIILSGQAKEDDLKQAIGPSFGGYIQKPFDLNNEEHWKKIREAFNRNDEPIIP